MKTPSIVLLGFISATLVLSSCGENPLDWFNGGKSSTGNVSGRVILQDGQFPSPPIPLTRNEYGGVTVSLVGTNLSTVTASDGSWSIRNVPKGVYDITFHKDGIGPQTISSWQFIGAGDVELPDQYLCLVPTAKLGGIDIQSFKNGQGIRLVVEPDPTSTPLGTPYHIVFFGSDPNVSHRPGTYTHYLYQPWTYLSLDPFFTAGERVYAVAYPVTQCDLQNPISTNNGRGKDPALFQDYFDILAAGKSEVVDFIY